MPKVMVSKVSKNLLNYTPGDCATFVGPIYVYLLAMPIQAKTHLSTKHAF